MQPSNGTTAAVNDESEYRQRHGRSSLLLRAGRGRFFICKHHDDTGAVLVELTTHAEVSVTADEFNSDFGFCMMDEAVFWFGSPEDKAAAQRHVDAHIAAARVCLEQDRVARAKDH